MYNKQPFQKREGSRYSVFQDEEVPFMRPLPKYDFELSQWKKATVQMNYHISVDKMNYSVPYEYVGRRVDVKISKTRIQVYYKSNLICEHSRLYGRRNQYSTEISHMPKNHQLYTWNGERFKKWAQSIGPETYKVIETQISRYKVEEQAYKGCLSILKLSEKYTKTRLEDACKLANDHISRPGYKNIRLILESGQDMKQNKQESSNEENKEYAFVRGGDYYGRNK